MADGRPQLALQLLRSLYRFVEAYDSDQHVKLDVSKQALFYCARGMMETVAFILQTQLRSAGVEMFLDVLLRASSNSAAFPSSADSWWLTMSLANACSTNLVDLQQHLFGTAIPTKYGRYHPHRILG